MYYYQLSIKRSSCKFLLLGVREHLDGGGGLTNWPARFSNLTTLILPYTTKLLFI